MSHPASVFFTGMASADAEQLSALFADINRRIGKSWRIAASAEQADVLVIDVDSIYGHMSWLQAQASGQRIVALTTAADAEADHVLHRPVTPQAMRDLLLALEGSSAPSAMPADPPAAPAVPAPEPEPAPTAPAAATLPDNPDSTAAPKIAPAEPPAAAAPAASNTAPAPQAAAPRQTPAPAGANAAQARQPQRLIDWLQTGALPDGPQQIEVPDLPPLGLDSRRKVFACGDGIKAFLPHARALLTASAVKPLTDAEFEALQRDRGGVQPWARLIWLAALGGNGGRLPGKHPGSRYRLAKWPRIEREFPQHFRIATTMMKGFQTPAAIAEASGAELASVHDFIAASLACGQAEIEAPAEPAAEPAPAATKGLLDRLRGTR